VTKTLEEVDVAASSIPPATFDYLSSLEWIRASENICLIGPAGTGKSHILIVLGIAAVEGGHWARYFTAAELVETLYRGPADNSVGKVIDNLPRNDPFLVDEFGFAPLDGPDHSACSETSRPPTKDARSASRPTGRSSPGDRSLPEHTIAISMLDRLQHHCHPVVTDGDSYRMRQARANEGSCSSPLKPGGGWALELATSGDRNLTIDKLALPRRPRACGILGAGRGAEGCGSQSCNPHV
jgi:hypothetical protein